MVRWSQKALDLSRRRFLLSAGGAALALPLLSSLPRRAWGAEFPRRLVIFWTPDGFERSTELGWSSTSKTVLQFARGSVLEPLTPFRSELILLENMRMAGQAQSMVNVHWGIRQLLTGATYSQNPGAPVGGYPSVDQFIARKIKSETRFPSLEVGVFSKRQFGTDYGELSYQEGGIAVARENDPRGVFKRMFVALSADNRVVEELYEKQRSVLDATYGDLKQIMGQVSAEDRARLESHTEAYRDLEKALAPYSGACQSPAGPGEVANDYAKAGSAHIKLLAMALRCDLTRVASIQWSYPVSNMPASYVGLNETTHNLGHRIGADWLTKVNKIQRFHAERFTELVRLLSEASEGPGHVLRHSAVVWCSELDEMPLAHTVAKMPFLIAGSAGGYLRTGRIVDGKQRNVNDLLVTLAQAMGVNPPKAQLGDPTMCKGELAQLRT